MEVTTSPLLRPVPRRRALCARVGRLTFRRPTLQNHADQNCVHRPAISVRSCREPLTRGPVARTGGTVTGEKTLVLGHFVKSFVGLSTKESQTQFTLLQDRVTKLENTTRWSWQLGDVAIWDNRATQHYAVADYGNQYRRLERITLAGDVPVGVDGVASRSIAGDATAYSVIDAS
ncbi:MAG: TauD/TfdA family dioxygenase [Rhodococcus sp. (in: high G+C Gram-positive bacteria)]